MIPGVPLQLQSPVADSSLGFISDDSVMTKAREHLTQKSNDTDDSVHQPVFKSESFFQLPIFFYYILLLMHDCGTSFRRI